MAREREQKNRAKKILNNQSITTVHCNPLWHIFVVLKSISVSLCETVVTQDISAKSHTSALQSNPINLPTKDTFYWLLVLGNSSPDKKSSTQSWCVCPSFPLTTSRPAPAASFQVQGCEVNVPHQRQKHTERERRGTDACHFNSFSFYISQERVTAHKGSFQTRAQWVFN